VEHRAFLLYYGPLVLRGILDTERYIHFLLAGATALLLGHSITPEHLVTAQFMIQKFLERFPQLYHRKFMSRTVHSLVHLVHCVKKTGPLGHLLLSLRKHLSLYSPADSRDSFPSSPGGLPFPRVLFKTIFD